MENEKEVKIGSETLILLYKSLIPYHYRIASVLEDIIKEKYTIGEIEKAVLLEQASCTTALKSIFETMLEEMEESEAKYLKVKREEYLNILSMTKSVEVATRMSFGNFGLWTH